MSDAVQLIREKIPDQAEANALMERLFEAARPEAVYGPPVTHGEYTAITASEVTIGLGYGFGGGGGVGPGDAAPSGEQTEAVGYGSGGGGGGGAAARPVAVIEVGPHGVRVEPIVDPTKIALAFFTTIGAMLMMLGKMKDVARS